MHHHHGRHAEHFRWTFEPCPITPLQLKLVQFRSFPAQIQTSLLHKKANIIVPARRNARSWWKNLEDWLIGKCISKKEKRKGGRERSSQREKMRWKQNYSEEEERFSLARSLDLARKTNTNSALKEEEEQERTFVLTRELRFREWTWPDVATAAAVHIHSVLLFSVVPFFFFFFFFFFLLLLFPPCASKT